MRTFFGAVTIALAFAAALGAALAWDGSYYLYRAMDAHAPFVPTGRLLNVLLQAPMLIVSLVTGDLAILRPIFGLTAAAIPLASLGASWLIVRKRAPALFIWPALGITLGTLPGQLQLTAEEIQVVQLIWPVLLGLVLGVPRQHTRLMTLFAGAVFLAHPASGVLLAIGAAVAVLAWRRYGDAGHHLPRWALTLAILALIRIVLALPDVPTFLEPLLALRSTYYQSVDGYPLLAVLATWLAAVLIYLTPLASRTAERDVRTVLFSTTVAALLAAGGLLLVRALNPEAWMSGVGFREWAAVASLPFFLLAIVEAFRLNRASDDGPKLTSPLGGYARYRLQLAQVAAGLFCVVLSTQSFTWWGLTQRLSETLPDGELPCISRASLHWTDRTALNHWSISPLALVLQSQVPNRLVLEGDRCTDARLSGTVAVTDWDRWQADQGWFKLGPVVSRERSERACWFTLPLSNAGWYGPEGLGRSWWRWSDGQGKVLIYVDHAGPATIQGSIESLQVPNRAEARLNGQKVQDLEITARGLRPFEAFPVTLQAGLNVLEVRSLNPAAKVSPDTRPLAISLGDLGVVPANHQLRCELRP
jgi:hypothetical protein